MKSVAILTTKSLADNEIDKLRTKLETLAWLDYSFPAVKEGLFQDGLTYPQVYNQDGTDTHQFLVPETDVQSFLFFEKRGYNISKDEIINNYDLRLICWLNLKKIGTYNYDFTDLLIKQVCDILKKNKCNNISVSLENPFASYSGIAQKNMQFLMYPYSGFAIDFTIEGQNC